MVHRSYRKAAPRTSQHPVPKSDDLDIVDIIGHESESQIEEREGKQAQASQAGYTPRYKSRRDTEREEYNKARKWQEMKYPSITEQIKQKAGELTKSAQTAWKESELGKREIIANPLKSESYEDDAKIRRQAWKTFKTEVNEGIATPVRMATRKAVKYVLDDQYQREVDYRGLYGDYAPEIIRMETGIKNLKIQRQKLLADRNLAGVEAVDSEIRNKLTDLSNYKKLIKKYTGGGLVTKSQDFADFAEQEFVTKNLRPDTVGLIRQVTGRRYAPEWIPKGGVPVVVKRGRVVNFLTNKKIGSTSDMIRNPNKEERSPDGIRYYDVSTGEEIAFPDGGLEGYGSIEMDIGGKKFKLPTSRSDFREENLPPPELEPEPTGSYNSYDPGAEMERAIDNYPTTLPSPYRQPRQSAYQQMQFGRNPFVGQVTPSEQLFAPEPPPTRTDNDLTVYESGLFSNTEEGLANKRNRMSVLGGAALEAFGGDSNDGALSPSVQLFSRPAALEAFGGGESGPSPSQQLFGSSAFREAFGADRGTQEPRSGSAFMDLFGGGTVIPQSQMGSASAFQEAFAPVMGQLPSVNREQTPVPYERKVYYPQNPRRRVRRYRQPLQQTQ